MSETMSSPTDWAKYYQQNLSGADADADAAAAAAASTGMMLTSNNLSSPHGSAPSSSSNLSPTEGRVSKPPHARRRSRASRRTPTTLLNTDTTNFRAMVQQFTGGPNSPFASTPSAHQSFGFGLGAVGNRQASHLQNPNQNPSSTVMLPSPGYRLQYQPQYHSQGYMISLGNVNNNPGAAGEGFFQRLGGNPRPPQPPQNTGVSDGFLIEMNNASSSSSRVPSSSNENRGNGFIF